MDSDKPSMIEGTNLAIVWPDWDGRNFDDIPRYINPSELEDAAIVPWIRFNDIEEEDPRELLRQIYEYFQSLGVRYGLEPWIFNLGQRIRWPALIRSDCGTCLDIALLYASVLLRCQIRPLLLFVKGDGATDNHVLVMADIRAPLQDLMLEHEQSRLPFARDEHRGMHTFVLNQLWSCGDFVVCDPTAATSKEWTYWDAVSSAEELLHAVREVTQVIIVDVASSIAQTQLEPFPIPNKAAGTSAVWTRLPPRYSPPPLSDTDELLASINASDRRIAILGESGTGKSTIAYMSAATWDNGYGWFINAADRSTLQSEYSNVEMMHRRRLPSASQIEDDQIALSRAALQRLGQSHMPWVVVLDNADNEPDSIADLVPEPSWPGQVVIVTSTHRAWAAWADHCISLGSVSAGGSRSAKSVDGPEFVPRRAIEVDLRLRLIKKSIEITADDIQSLVSLVGRHLSEPARRLALDIAWAPATALEIEKVAHTESDQSLAAAVRELSQLGIVGVSPSTLFVGTMHRLIASEVRAWEVDSPEEKNRRLVRLMSNDYLIEMLSVRAEEAVLHRLIGLAEGSAASDGLSNAIFLLSNVLELRGLSTEAASIAALCLSLDNEQLSIWDVALARLRVVRHVKNHVKERAELQNAFEAVAELLDSLPDDDAPKARLVRYQCLAMLGHLRRQVSKRSLTGDRLMEELQVAKRMLLESVAGRAELIGAEDWRLSVERELSLFNIAAISLDLGKCAAANPAVAASFLGDSLYMYTAVKNAVTKAHGRGVNHPRRAAAEYGRALCYYYSALLGVRPAIRSESEILEISERFGVTEIDEMSGLVAGTTNSSLLVAAHEATLESLRERMRLQVGNRDDADVVKCLRLNVEISAARIVWETGGRAGTNVRDLPARMVEGALLQTEQNFRNDWRIYGQIPVGTYERLLDAGGEDFGYRRYWFNKECR